ncbi:MAG: ATPase with chaperone activity [Burkholderiaceae bacterium]|jgi:hypothetical protein
MMAATMSPDNQIVIPPSFVAVYTDPGRHKPREPWAHVAQRYELCEDMAQMLVNPASEQMHKMGITPDDVAHTCVQGLLNPESGLLADEAVWVGRRLAELLEMGGFTL